MSIRSRGLVVGEGLVVEGAQEVEGCRPVVVEAVEESRLEHLLAGEAEGVVVRSKMEVVEEARVGRSMMAMEEVVARSSLAKVVGVAPQQLVLGALVERWKLVTGEVQRFWMADLEAHLVASLEAHLAASLEVVARTGEVKEVRPLQASWEAMVAAAQKAVRSFLVPEEVGEHGHGLQVVVERFFVLQMAEEYRTWGLILRQESLTAGVEVVVQRRATWLARRVRICQHWPAVEGRRILVSAVKLREEASTLD